MDTEDSQTLRQTDISWVRSCNPSTQEVGAGGYQV